MFPAFFADVVVVVVIILVIGLVSLLVVVVFPAAFDGLSAFDCGEFRDWRHVCRDWRRRLNFDDLDSNRLARLAVGCEVDPGIVPIGHDLAEFVEAVDDQVALLLQAVESLVQGRFTLVPTFPCH